MKNIQQYNLIGYMITFTDHNSLYHQHYVIKAHNSKDS